MTVEETRAEGTTDATAPLLEVRDLTVEFAGDEVQRGDEIGHPLGAAALAASPQAPEQVEVAEDAVENIGRRDTVLVGLLRAREVRLVRLALTEPLPDDA